MFIDLSPFNIGDNRPGLVRRIKELQPDASNRAIAKAVGADEKTIRNDSKPPADNSAGDPHDLASDLPKYESSADNSAPEPESYELPEPEPEQLPEPDELLAAEPELNPAEPESAPERNRNR